MNEQTSEYSANLSEKDFTRYREKLKLTTGEQLQIHILSKKSGLMIFPISRKLHGGMSQSIY